MHLMRGAFTVDLECHVREGGATPPLFSAGHFNM